MAGGMVPVNPRKKEQRNATQCAACGVDLGRLFYFCRECWFEVPAKERASLYHMHHTKQDAATKVAKICRMLRQKRKTNENETEQNIGPKL